MDHLGHQIGGAFVRRNKRVSDEVQTFNSCENLPYENHGSVWDESDISKYESTIKRFRNVGKFQLPFFQSPEITALLASNLPASTIRARLYEIVSTMNLVFVLMAGMIGQIALSPLDVNSIPHDKNFMGTSHRTIGSLYNFVLVLTTTIHLSGVGFTSYYLMQLSATSDKHIVRTAALSGTISVWQIATVVGIFLPLVAVYCGLMIRMPEAAALACIICSVAVFIFLYLHFFSFASAAFPVTMLPWTYGFAPCYVTSSTTDIARRMVDETMLKAAETADKDGIV